MSEQNSLSATTETTITDEDLIEFWQDRGAKANCEICSANDWMNTIEIDGHRPTLYADKSEAAHDGPFKLASIFSICTNCGNVRTFARFVVEKYLKNKVKETPNV